MAKTLDDVVEELVGIRREMVTKSDLARELGEVRSEFSRELGVVRSDFSHEFGVVRSEFSRELGVVRSDFSIELDLVRSGQEELKEELLKALAGIANQQTSFVTLLTKLLNDREESDRRFARLEAEVFGSKH